MPTWNAQTCPGDFRNHGGIEFFVYSRAVPTAAETEPDPALNEAHWAYMDRFAAGMVARGPTLGADRESWTGSLHIVDLPSAEAANEFVENEPYNRAGLFSEHLIRRFRNLLGRTMWEAAERGDDPRFLVIAQGPPSDFNPPARDSLILLGELLSPEDGVPLGVALALQAADRGALADCLGRTGDGIELEILDWEFGGRR